MSMLKGETVTLVNKGVITKIEWKQGSVLGFGGDKMQNYQECTYKTNGGGMILVYIQQDYDMPDNFVIDSKCQYGMQNGVLFLVIHDKSQTPYQHRFMMNPGQEVLKLSNELLKLYKGVDLSWIAGDYLRDFE